MPFLIIETIENGSKKLSICPEGWVANGVLSWPTKKTSKKCKLEQLMPKDTWLKMACIIKRKFNNYEDADAELNAMVELPDTENEGYVNIRRPDNENYNEIAKQLSNDVPNDNNIMTQNIEHIDTEVVQVLDCNDLLTNQKILSDNQAKILDNQIKIIKTLATISVKIDNLASNFQKQPQIHPQMTVKPLSNELKRSPCNARVTPIQNLDDLQSMENQLRDADKRKFLKDLYSVFCTPGKKGEVCAFQLIDVFFRREFLVECSWSGSARGAGSKICIKVFQEVLSFFFELVHDCDPTYTVDKNNDFFKSIVKNAKKRTHSKLGRASAPRNVPKRKLAAQQQSRTTKKSKPSAGPSKVALEYTEVACNDNDFVDQNELITSLNTDKNEDKENYKVIDKEAAIDNELHTDEITRGNENDKN